MSHWFGLAPGDLDEIPAGELQVYVKALEKLPPLAGAFLYEPAKKK